MKASALFFVGLLCSITQVQGADRTPPPGYKKNIEAFLAAQHPQYGRFYCDYYEPKRVLVGDMKHERCAVRCDWGASLKSGAVLLMMVSGTFLFDGHKISLAGRDEKIEWVDGQPSLDKKKPNQMVEPTPQSRGGPP